MNFKYNVEVLELREVHEIPGAWSEIELKALLEFIEYDDVLSIPTEEIREMAAMALSDFSPEEAAEKVLEFRFGEKLKSGQRENISEELKEERLWEEYAEISFHEELFNVACMLFWAFPRIYSEPDIVKIQLKISSLNAESASNLKAPSASFIARVLNDGMDENNAIYRLFDENIESDSFPDSEGIIWVLENIGYNETEKSNTITIYTAWNWVVGLKGVKSFDSTAFSDGQFD